MNLSELTFSDLFVGPTNDWSWFKETSGSRVSCPIPAECHVELEQLRARLLQLNTDKKDQRVLWPIVGGESLRVTRKDVADGVTLFILRRFNLNDDLSLDMVKLPTAIANVLRSDHPLLRSGIVGFFGRTGAGKSTTGWAFLLDRLRLYGGAAWMIENPSEIPLQGRHGAGWLYQIEVERDEQIGDEIRELYRAVPNMLFIGEVRDARTAREVVRAAGSGYLLVITFHGNDLASSISQFVRLATDGNSEATAARVAEVLRAALYLELHTTPVHAEVLQRSLVSNQSTGEPPQSLSADVLFFLEAESAARNAIRAGEYHLLTSEINRQRRALMANKLTFGI